MRKLFADAPSLYFPQFCLPSRLGRRGVQYDCRPCALSRAFAHGRDELLLALHVTVRWECMLYCSSRRLQTSRRRMPSGTNLMTGCLPSSFDFCYSPFQACRSAMLHSSLRARPVGSSLFFQHRKRVLPEGTGVLRTAPLFLAADW